MQLLESPERPPQLAAADLANLFGVLSDPTRIAMLRLLAASDEVACTTFEKTFPISKSTISYHVKALRQAGLISVRKDGKYFWYTLLHDTIEQRLPGLLALIAGSTAERSADAGAPRAA